MQAYILIAAAVSIPLYVLMRLLLRERQRKKQQRELATAYDRLVKKHKLFVEHTDLLSDKIIGIDKRKKMLLLIDHSAGTKQEFCIPLQDIAATKIVEKKGEQKEGIKAVLLELKHTRNNIRTRFCFFDEKQNDLSELKSLSRRAIHWKNRVDLHKHPGSVNHELEFVL